MRSTWIPALAVGLALWSAGPASAFQSVTGELRPEEARRQPDHVAVRLLGRVVDPRTDGRAFAIEVDGMRFQVEFGGAGGGPGFGLRPPVLREGDRVVVYGTLNGVTRVQARQVILVNSTGDGGTEGEGRRLTGHVRALDARRDRLSVRTDDGGLVEVQYDRQTTLARLGRRTSPEDLRVGDAVWLQGRWLDRDRLQASRIEVTATSAAWRSGDSGDVVSVNRRDSTLRVRFGSGERQVDVGGAQLVANGQVANSDRLRSGTRVRVFGEERDTRIRARRVELLDDGNGALARRLEGTVRSVDSGGRLIVLAPEGGASAPERLYVTGGTVIERNGRRLVLREIQTGDRLRVRAEQRGGRLEAEFIEILP